jgi:hypothetical protein
MKKILLLIVLALPLTAWFLLIVLATLLELSLEATIKLADAIEHKLNK